MYRYWDSIYVFEIGNLLSFKIIPQVVISSDLYIALL